MKTGKEVSEAAKKAAPTLEEARKIAQRFIDGHFHNGGKEHPRISIPCDEMRDDDILLIKFIDSYSALQSQNEKMREALNAIYAKAASPAAEYCPDLADIIDLSYDALKEVPSE